MSKKSRKRNKKILAALALAGGAAMLAKRKKASIADTDDAGINVTHPALTGPYITKKDKTVPVDTTPVIKKDSGFKPRVYPGTVLNARYGPRNALPPSMKGGAPHAEGYQKYGVTGTRTGTGRPQKVWGWSGTPSLRAKGGRIGAKKGGSVTGIAKRGFGRALMKGKK